MKASPCHSVVSPRLMGAVARDLHIVGGLSVCRLYYEKMCVFVYVIHLYTLCMCVCVFLNREMKSQVFDINTPGVFDSQVFVCL